MAPRAVPPAEDWDVSRIAYIYADPTAATLKVQEVADYLQEKLGIPCEIREDFFSVHGGDDLEADRKSVV